MGAVAGLLTIEEAQRLILGRVRPLPEETVALERAAGRVLAEGAVARVDLPPFASSAMDGFAVRSADVPGTLPVVARIAAGRPATQALASGEAMAIATGGAVPDGADAVVPIEGVVEKDNTISVPGEIDSGRHVRPRGSDVGSGDEIAPRGSRLSPARLGALAAAGVPEVRCASRPRAVVLATGTELRRPGEELRPGELYEANGLLLEAALGRDGAEVDRLPAVADDEDAHRAALERGLAADLLVTTGGVSVGPHDLVRRIETELGVEEVFWRVAVKPGKPISFGVRGSTLVFGLPGNPVSTLVGYELFVRPAVLALQCVPEPLPAFLPGRLARAVRCDPARDELLRAHLEIRDDGAVLDPVTGQESHMIVRSASADALVLIRRGDGELSAGAPVSYLALG
jgi:molybdopterin molybdotransferase